MPVHISLLRYTTIMQWICHDMSVRDVKTSDYVAETGIRDLRRNDTGETERHTDRRPECYYGTMHYKCIANVHSLTHNAPGRWLRPKSLATCPAKSLMVRTLSGTWTIHLAAASGGVFYELVCSKRAPAGLPEDLMECLYQIVAMSFPKKTRWKIAWPRWLHPPKLNRINVPLAWKDSADLATSCNK